MKHNTWRTLLHVPDVRALLTGFLLLSSAMIFTTLGVVYLMAHGLLEKKFHLYAVYRDGTGIIKGAKVLLNGVEIGMVDDVQLDLRTARPILHLSISDRYRELIRVDSRAFFKRDRNMVSDRALNIEMGKSPLAMQSGDTLYLDPPEDLESAITSLASLTAHVSRTLDRVDSVLARVTDTSTSMGALLMKDDLYRSTMRTLTQIDMAANSGNRTLAQINDVSSVLQRRIPVLLDRADSLGANLNRTTQSTDSLLVQGQDLLRQTRELAGDARLIARQGTTLLDRSDRLFGGLSQSFWLRGYLLPARQSEDRLPSGDVP